ncbi:MAG TPA: peptide ABC transporter substrate-binding protein [Gemmatimonadales bacterium]|nr:peptide ABC transporter substrate-binding protein [Gemmatimonadales bacterium]
MIITRSRRPTVFAVLLLALVASDACSRRGSCRGEYCGTLVLSVAGSVTTLLPPVSTTSAERNIFDQIFLRLADFTASGVTIGDSGFVPQLARSWEWNDPLTLTFHLDPRARWQDGPPVTAADVQFTFESYTDTAVAAGDLTALRHIASVTATDSFTAVFRFRNQYPEAFFDATFHMRILPAHLLRDTQRRDWSTGAFGHAPIGNGPYRLVRWVPNETVELAADSSFFLGRPHVRRLIWRFATDMNLAVTQVVSGEADAVEVLVGPANIERAQAAEHLQLYPYPGVTYTFLRFNLRANGDSLHQHPLFADPDVRRALVLATDRASMVQSATAGRAKVPPGPMPQKWTWLWVPELTPPPYDTAQANQLLTARGWRDSDGDGFRDRAGRKLSFHVTVPSTSGLRKQYARLLQEQFRAVGAELLIDEMDNAAQGERLAAGTFDAALESFETDPTPTSGIPSIWGGGGGSNFGHYRNALFDRQVSIASAAPTQSAAVSAWVTALKTLERDAPGIMLYALDNVAAVDKRFTDVQIRADSWLALVRNWRIPPDRLNERDRVGR